MSTAYLDASALVKLFKPEVESAALIDGLGAWPTRVSSCVIAVEASCAAHRIGTREAVARADAAVTRIELIALSGGVLTRARQAFDPPLRALDAIHLATAIELGDDVGAFFAYDQSLLSAARAAGLAVESPAVNRTVGVRSSRRRRS